MLEINGILSCIGNTPLVPLEKVFPNAHFKLFGKIEGLNPGGSVKDRPAIKMVQAALKEGIIDENTTIVESSSGNLGIGLSQACAYWGLKFVCVTDRRCTETNIKIMKAYGTRVEKVTEPDPETGDLLVARLKRVQHLLDTIPNSFNCNQYKNKHNPLAHHQTAEEIFAELDYKVDYVFCTTSTCGTLRGFSDYIKKKGLNTKVIAVDAVGSIIFGDTPKKRLIPGHGAGIIPPHYQKGIEDGVVHVSDLDCVVGCHKLVHREGIFAGGSSGAVLAGIDKINAEIPEGAVCVSILCDSGVRYLDSVYSEEWIAEHFGEISHLWDTPVESYSV